MSKQSIAKNEMGFMLKPVFPRCAKCKNLSFDKIDVSYYHIEYKNRRCKIGGFRVLKSSLCDYFEENNK